MAQTRSWGDETGRKGFNSYRVRRYNLQRIDRQVAIETSRDVSRPSEPDRKLGASLDSEQKVAWNPSQLRSELFFGFDHDSDLPSR